MINNPTPATPTKTRVTGKHLTSAPPKRDINLISNRESQERIARTGLFIIAALVALLGFGYFAIYLPKMAVDLMQLQLDMAKNELATLDQVETEYTALIERRDTLVQMLDAVTNTEAGTKGAYDITQMVERACPDTIELHRLSYNVDDVRLGGLAQDDTDVAQLLANLQSYPEFSAVLLTSVGAHSEQSPAQSIDKQRAFEIVAYFAQPIAESDPTNSDGGGAE